MQELRKTARAHYNYVHARNRSRIIIVCANKVMYYAYIASLLPQRLRLAIHKIKCIRLAIHFSGPSNAFHERTKGKNQ